MAYYVYMLRCGDDSLYTGIAADPARRLAQHKGERAGGAKYTAAHRAERFEAVWYAADRAAASRLEYRIKALTRTEKLRLIVGDIPPGFDLAGHPRMELNDKGEMTPMLFICYPKCSTCKKAREFLKSHGVDFTERDISIDNPTETELRLWRAQSGLPLRRFFNTSGMRYREHSLAARLPAMCEEEQYSLLSSDGMLVKRPILISGDTVLVGFREAEWIEIIG